MAESYSLSELGKCIKMTLKTAFAEPVWVRAEISEMHENVSGHCYLDLIEKADDTDVLVAKQKATIWAFTYRMLKPYFESETGATLRAGMKVLLLCEVEFHEVYGVSLNVRDIDPAFTVGEMAVRRAEIIRRLTDEGIVDMNKQLPLPPVPQRVAVISSASAAGFGDFCDQLRNNVFGYTFYTKLFPATMQGAQTEQSVVAALDKICDFIDNFDVVVIIRGGGATSDLVAFDNYNLALHCAQFPLPIISGIGHQRDESVVDLVAHTRVKTPTAAAEFLVARINDFEKNIDEMAQNVAFSAREVVHDELLRLQQRIARLGVVQRVCVRHDAALQHLTMRLRNAAKMAISSEEKRMALVEKSIEYADPATLLQRGFTLTTKHGKIVKSVCDVAPGDIVTTHLVDGAFTAMVQQREK
ncbi:MAG: exodeoxyribonuclease VII large subunit [Paludibacteraceae bacterium]|nr:exodeoxyribonuclease VII large subunit [Paludibacteraceae bacterium]